MSSYVKSGNLDLERRINLHKAKQAWTYMLVDASTNIVLFFVDNFFHVRYGNCNNANVRQ